MSIDRGAIEECLQYYKSIKNIMFYSILALSILVGWSAAWLSEAVQNKHYSMDVFLWI